MRAGRALLGAGLFALTVAAAVAIAVTTGGGHGSPVADPGLVVGVTANALDDDAARMARRVRHAGVRWMREEVRWGTVEPQRGRFSFGRYDRLFGVLARRGVHVLPVLIESPPWLSDALYRLPTQLGLWQHFVRAVTARYGPAGSFWQTHPKLDRRLAPGTWEIWNEPYYSQFSGGHPDAAAYGALVRATVQAGRGVDPALRFLTAAETEYAPAPGRFGDWTADLFRTTPGLGAYLDAFAVHPYAPGDPRATASQGFTRFGRLPALMARLGLPVKPVWITEVGWSTCSVRPACVDPSRQGSYLTSALRLVAGRYRHLVKAIFVYRFDDLRGASTDPQTGFGLIDRGHRAKPAYAVLRRAAEQAG